MIRWFFRIVLLISSCLIGLGLYINYRIRIAYTGIVFIIFCLGQQHPALYLLYSGAQELSH